MDGQVVRRADLTTMQSPPACGVVPRLTSSIGVLALLLVLAALGHLPALSGTPAMAGMAHQAPAVCAAPCSTALSSRDDEQRTAEAERGDDVSVSSYPGSASIPPAVRKQLVAERLRYRSPPKVPLYLQQEVLRN